MNEKNSPLFVEIITYAPTAFYHCTHCEVTWQQMGIADTLHREQTQASLPPDLAESYQAVSDWIRELFGRYCDRIAVQVIDAASFEGFWKSLRYWVRRYPAIIVNHTDRFQAGAIADADNEIERLLALASTVQD